MLVYYFVPFIVSNRYLLFWVSNGHNSVTVQNRTHVYINFFDHKDLGNHLLQLCPKVVKHPVYIYIWKSIICYVCSERAAGDMCVGEQRFFFLYAKFNYTQPSGCRYVNLIQYHKQTAKVFISELPYVLQYGSCCCIPYHCSIYTGIC